MNELDTPTSTTPAVPPSQPGQEPKHTPPKWLLILIAVLAAVALVGTAASLIFMNNKPAKTEDLTEGVEASVLEIPELGIQIADPENRGLKVFYDDSAKAQCEMDSNYYAGGACDNYLNSEHCQDMNTQDDFICSYYIYDDTTYDPDSPSSTNAADYAQYFPCDSSLQIYESSTGNGTEETDYNAFMDVNDKSIALLATPPSGDTTCDEASADSADAYMKDLLQYVKANASAL